MTRAKPSEDVTELRNLVEQLDFRIDCHDLALLKIAESIASGKLFASGIIRDYIHNLIHEYEHDPR